MKKNPNNTICGAVGIGLCLILIMFLGAGKAQAAIEYLPSENVIHVTDYPQERPCQPADLYRVDCALGWNKVTYDPQINLYKLDCGLRIGANDGSSTYFQIGSEQKPNETLIVCGTVHVSSCWLKGENRDMSYHQIRALGRVNRLTIGDPERSSVGGRLLIDNQKRAGHTLIVGGLSGHGSENHGGDLRLFNGLISSFGDVPIGAGKPVQRVHMGGSGTVEFSNATIRGLASGIGRHLARATVENTQFENCGFGFSGSYQTKLTDCVFKNCGVGVTGASRNPLVLYECSFRGNTANWKLRYYPLIAIDCEIDTYDNGLYLKKRNVFFISKRHVIVKVVDESGNPVKGAVVQVKPSSPPRAPAFDVFQAITKQKGTTPGPGEKGALLLSETLISASSQNPQKLERVDYRYDLVVRKGNARGELKDIKATKSWSIWTVVVNDGDKMKYKKDKTVTDPKK